METKNVIFELRTKMGLSQDELAENICYSTICATLENGETTTSSVICAL